MDEGAFLATIAASPADAGPHLVYADWLEESGRCNESEAIRNYLSGERGMIHFPGKVGDKVLICTVTLYYVGEIAELGVGFVRLKDASWVHWTGRLSELTRAKDFTKVRSNRKPRTEFAGDVGLALQSVIGWYPGDWKLPKESIQ